MRIALDNALGRPWRDVLTGRGAAYKQMDAVQFGRALAVAERMLAEGPASARALNDTSLRLRGKR